MSNDTTTTGWFFLDQTLDYIVQYLIVLVCFVSNGIVLVVFVRERVFTFNKYFYFLSLSIAGLIQTTTHTISLSTRLFNKDQHTEEFCTAIYCILYASCTLTMYLIFLVTIDRYISVMYPFWYEEHATKRVTRLAVMTVWLLSAGLGTISLIFIIDDSSLRTCNFTKIFSDNFHVISGIINLDVPIIVMGVMYTHLLIVSRRHNRALQSRPSFCEPSSRDSSDKISDQMVNSPTVISMCGSLFEDVQETEEEKSCSIVIPHKYCVDVMHLVKFPCQENNENNDEFFYESTDEDYSSLSESIRSRSVTLCRTSSDSVSNASAGTLNVNYSSTIKRTSSNTDTLNFCVESGSVEDEINKSNKQVKNFRRKPATKEEEPKILPHQNNDEHGVNGVICKRSSASVPCKENPNFESGKQDVVSFETHSRYVNEGFENTDDDSIIIDTSSFADTDIENGGAEDWYENYISEYYINFRDVVPLDDSSTADDNAVPNDSRHAEVNNRRQISIEGYTDDDMSSISNNSESKRRNQFRKTVLFYT